MKNKLEKIGDEIMDGLILIFPFIGLFLALTLGGLFVVLFIFFIKLLIQI